MIIHVTVTYMQFFFFKVVLDTIKKKKRKIGKRNMRTKILKFKSQILRFK